MRHATWLALLAGCASSTPPPSRSGTPPIAGLTAIQIQPGMQTLVMDGSTPAAADYKAIGTFNDGHTDDVTNRVAFSVENADLGMFQGAHFVSDTDHGGITNVIARAGDVAATAPLYLMIRRTFDDASSQFEGPATGAAPNLLYPADGVLFPPNLRGLEIHFDPAGHKLFEIDFSNPITDVRVYTGCTRVGTGCIYTIADDVWGWVSRTNAGVAGVNVSVRGTDNGGDPVGSSAPITFQISRDPLIGAVYYWTTSNGTAIMRYDFASPNPSGASQFAGPSMAGGECIGCHALSRDGSKLVAEVGGQNDGRLLLLDVATAKPLVPLGSTGKSIFESWDPDGSRFVGVYGDTGATDFNLQLFDGNTGAIRGDIAGTGTAANPADHPDWSPDGKSIAYVKVGRPNTLQRMGMGAIMTVGANGGASVTLVPALAGKNRYYPAYSPDSQFVVFDESTCPAGLSSDESCDADTDPSATLFAVMAKPGSSPVRLDRANASGNLTNSFPKWSPFVFRRSAGEASSRLMWLTFSSSRPMGARSPTGVWIWMAGIDPDQIGNGVDGSYPAFALPIQDFGTSNHIAQWATQIVPAIQ
jgi:hypothetical protein